MNDPNEDAKALNSLAQHYANRGLYDQAEPLYLRALAIVEQALGPDHPHTATSLSNLASIYKEQRLFGQAEPLYLRALAIIEQALGPDHPYTATSLNNLAGLYREQGLYNQAELLDRRALAIWEQALGPDHPYTATSLNNLAVLCTEQGLYSQAEPLFRRALAIREQALGPDHPHTAATLNNLAGLYREQGLFSQAEPLLRRALTIREQALGPEHPDTAASFNNLAALFMEQGLYSQAEPLLRRALAIREQALGPDHPSTAASLNNLGELYSNQGLYSKAEPLYRRALGIIEQALGPDHPYIGTSLNNLAALCVKKGLYSQAEPFYKRALAITEQALGPEHPSTAASLNNLAELYSNQGLYSKAEPLYRRALGIVEQALGPDHPYIGTSLNNLATLFMMQRLYNQAESLLRRALAITEQVLGPDHPHTASSLNSLAALFMQQRLYSQAAPLYRRALGITEKALGPDHPWTAFSLNNLAGLYREQGRYSQAEPLYQRAVAIMVKVLGLDHPDTADSLSNLAVVRLFASRQQPQPVNHSPSATLFARSLRARLAWLYREAPLMAAASRQQLPALRQPLEELPMDMAAMDSEFARLLLFARLNFHGLLQQIEQRQAEVSRLPGVHQEMVERLRYLGTVLASTQLQPQQRRELAAERNDLEAQLYRLLPDAQLSPAELRDVATALPSLSALIEFQRYTPLSTITLNTDTTPRYLAFILLPGDGLEVIDLGPASPLEAAIEEALSATVKDFADAAEAWIALSERLLSPLLAHLGGCISWFLSLDGELHRIPFHCLPLPGHPDRFLVELIQLRLLTSGRDLLDRSGVHPAPDPVQPAMVVADPAFDHSPALSSPDVAGRLPRSRDMSSLKVWPPLPDTAKEGRELAELLGADLRVGAAATALAVQQARQPRVLHIATHGFFLSTPPEEQEAKPWSSFDGHTLLANFRWEDPLLRSGLVFAGANHPVSNPEEDDGYLTAQEAIHMDLHGTELVTLSACDTCCGDIHPGEGVYGLQRALIVAGARSMLLSLWKVPDDATCEFMVRFYTLLNQGAARGEALVAVQREFRQHENIIWRRPYYWGAWQLIGDWRPIKGLDA